MPSSSTRPRPTGSSSSGGALGAGDSFLLMLNAESEAEIRRCLDDDPWAEMGLLRIRSIEPWQQLTGPDLIAAAASTLT